MIEETIDCLRSVMEPGWGQIAGYVQGREYPTKSASTSCRLAIDGYQDWQILIRIGGYWYEAQAHWYYYGAKWNELHAQARWMFTFLWLIRHSEVLVLSFLAPFMVVIVVERYMRNGFVLEQIPDMGAESTSSWPGSSTESSI